MMNSPKSLVGDLRIEKGARRRKRGSPILLIMFVLVVLLAGAGAFVWWRTQIWAPEVRTVFATAADAGPKTVLNASGYVVAPPAGGFSAGRAGEKAKFLLGG